MEIIKTPIEDLLIIKPQVFEDAEGFSLNPIANRNSKKLDSTYSFVRTTSPSLVMALFEAYTIN